MATLVDEWSRLGLSDVVICPGSRSTPMTLAFWQCREISVHVRIDERSAAFFALGRSLVTSRPVALVVTSGTAAAEVHAAVAEADLANVALVVITADRPPELHGVGAPQTIDQQRLFGAKVRLYEEPGVARIDAAMSWRPLARRLYFAAAGEPGRRGPVHLNAAFVEPLLAPALELPPPAKFGASPWAGTVWRAAPIDISGQRVMCVVGGGIDDATRSQIIAQAREAKWAVVGDATASDTLSYADPLLRHDAIWETLRPDVVVRIGGIPASKFLAQRLVTSGVDMIALEGAGPVADPDGVIVRRVPGMPCANESRHEGDERYAAQWNDTVAWLASHLARTWTEDLDEIIVARTVVDVANETSVALVLGSSMPVRDVEWWTSTRQTSVFSNRGANGIDGVVSTFLGVAERSRAIGLVGDVTMLHDVSALVDGPGLATRAVLVVSDNVGGGIFSFLPQARQMPLESFEQLFATPRAHDLCAVARAFGHHAQRVSTVSQLRVAVEEGLERDGLSVVVAQLPSRDDNVARHEELNELVAEWWGER